MRGVPPMIVSKADSRLRVHVAATPECASTTMLRIIDTISGTKPNQHQPVCNGPTVQFGDRARGDDEQEEGENARLDRERPKRDLLVAEHAGDAHHAAVEDGQCEQRQRERRFAARRGGFDFGWSWREA